MKISNLTLNMKRGGAPLYVPPSSIKFFTMSCFTRSIQVVSPDSVDLVTYCDLFVLELFGDSKNAKNAINVLLARKDLVSAEVTLIGEDGELFTEFVRFGWESTAASSDGPQNPHQSMYLSRQGNLYIVISPGSKIEDYFDIDVIDTNNWARDAERRISLGVR